MRAGRYLKRASIPPVVERGAVVGARIPETRVNAASGRRQVDSSILLAIGGRFRSLRFGFSNCQFDGNGAKFDMPTELTIRKAAFRLNGKTRPILFDRGQRSAVLPVGLVCYWSSPVLPYQYGLPEFREGMVGMFRGCASVPNNTGSFPIGCPGVNSTGEAFGALYDPANDLDQVDGDDPMELPLDALTVTDFTAVGVDTETNNQWWGPSIVIGETPDKRLEVVFLLGPSTHSGREALRIGTSQYIGWGGQNQALLTPSTSPPQKVTPVIQATRTGAHIGNIGRNSMVTPFFKYATLGNVWGGNNAIADDVTPKVEVEENLTDVYSSMCAAGISKFIMYLGLGRNQSTDNFKTYAGLSPTSGRYDHGGAADYLNRRVVHWASRRRNVLVLAMPYLRSFLDSVKWITDEVTEKFATVDGFHPSQHGHDLIEENVRWAMRTGVGLSPLSKNWAAACLVTPSLEMMALVEEVLGLVLLSGAQLQQLWWLDAPISGSDASKQTRRVNLITPGVWDLFHVNSASGITYGAAGTKSDGTQQMGFYNTPFDDWSPGIANTPELAVASLEDLAIFAGVNDDADTFPIFGTPTGTTAERTLTINPKNASGQIAVRLNDTTTSTWTSSGTAVGDWALIRNGNTRWAFQDKVQRGTGTVAPTKLSAARCRLFGSINVGDTSLKELRYLAIGRATPAQAALVTDALALLKAT